MFMVATVMYTSAQELQTAKMYAILKDAQRLRRNMGKLKTTELVLFYYGLFIRFAGKSKCSCDRNVQKSFLKKIMRPVLGSMKSAPGWPLHRNPNGSNDIRRTDSCRMNLKFEYTPLLSLGA